MGRFHRIALLVSVFLFLHYSAEAAPGPNHPPPLGKLVDVGGYRVHLYCTGTGSPTVMIVGGGFSFDWGLVQPQVAKFTRICTYDPSGTVWSDPFPLALSQQFPTCSQRVEELHGLVRNASTEGPYVLVGFSIGGLYARFYAHNYPKEVAGMVIVDHAFINPGEELPRQAHSSSPEKPLSPAQLDSPPVLISKTPITLGIEDDQNFNKLPQTDQALHRWAMSTHPLRPTAEAAAECFSAIDKATQENPHPLDGMPLVVISTNNDSPNYRNLQMELLSLSRNSRHLIAEDSSHMVIIDQPAIVVQAIREVVAALRNHTGLPK